MAENHTPQDLENVEIAPLSDEALEDVAGGAVEPALEDDCSNGCCSCHTCS